MTARESFETPVEVALFGTPQLRLPEGRMHALERRDAAILAYLAFEGATTRNRLVELLWPDSEPEAARNTLRQRLFQLKKRAGRELVSGAESLSTAAGVIVTPDDGRDVSLLDGHDFSDCPAFDDWLKKQRNRLSNRRRDSLVSLADDAENGGRLTEALAIAEELVANEPLHEDGHRRLMRLHYLKGDRAAALQAFDRCEQILKDELSARPDKETLALLAQIEKAELARTKTVRPVPPTVLHPPILIGRAREWQALGDAWDASHSIIVTGAAGLGKSRLIDDFTRSRENAGRQALTVSARPGDERLPYAVLSRLLRGVLSSRTEDLLPGVREELARVLPELGTFASSGSINAARFVNAVEAVFEQAITSGLVSVVLDDLHFADDASLEVLQHLTAQAQLRWIVAFREGEVSAAGKTLVDALSRTSAARAVALAPLTLAEVSELVDSLGIEEIDSDKWAGALHKRTGGNPLFLLETIKSMLAQPAESALIPSNTLPVGTHIGALIERRITRLSPEAVRIARCAAVAGQDFSAELTAHVLKSTPLDLADGWAELEAAQVLRNGAFTHDLIYEAALASVPLAIARHLHAEIANYLISQSAPPLRIAPHAQAAGMTRVAAEHWKEAGRKTERAGRFLDASLYFEHAAENFEALGDADAAFDALREQAQARATHLNDVVADELLVRLEVRARDAPQRLAAMQLHVHHLSRRGEHRRAIELGRRALELMSCDGNPSVQLRLACSMAHAYTMLFEPDLAQAVLQPCELWVRHYGNPEERILYEGSLAQVLECAGRLTESIDNYASALTIARQDSRADDIAMLTANMALAYHSIGDLRRALELAEQAAVLMADNEDGRRTGNLLSIEVTMAKYLLDLGRYREAITLLERLGPEFQGENATYWQVMTDMLLAAAFIQLGQFARAHYLLRAERTDVADHPQKVMFFGLRCALAWAKGSVDQQSLAEAARAVIAASNDRTRHVAILWQARLLPDEEALVKLASVIDWMLAHERRGQAMAAHVDAAAAARRLRRADLPATHVRTALALADRHYAPLRYRGELWLEGYLSLKDAGDSSAASHTLEAGVDWLRTTLTQVPPEFRSSFLERNQTNVQLLGLARRHRIVTF